MKKDKVDNSLNSKKSNDFLRHLSQEIESLPEEQKKVILSKFTTISRASSFSGPLPPPEDIKKYNEIVENGAERIFAMAEKQLEHRIQIEKYAVKKELKQRSRGQFFGFSIGIVSIICATVLAVFGHGWVASAFVTVGIGSLAVAFVVGNKQKQSK